MSEDKTVYTTKRHGQLGNSRDTHMPYRWIVQNEDDLRRIENITKEDLFKTALALEGGAIYTLVSVTPIIWVLLEGQNGPQGEKGDTGPMGPQGEPGVGGSRGPQGPVGATGPKGDAGPMGPRGETGAKGDTGPQGVRGPTGTSGPQGPMGPRGEQGDTGPQGAQGPIGVRGPQGPIGPAGPIGNDGPRGPKGVSLLDGSVYHITNFTSSHSRMINLAYASSVTGTNSMVNSSRNTAIQGDFSMVNSSDNASLSGNYSQINATSSGGPTVIAAGTNASQINASTAISNIDITRIAKDAGIYNDGRAGSQINASRSGAIYGAYSQVNASWASTVRTSHSQIHASRTCEISHTANGGDYSQIMASSAVKLDDSMDYVTVWGWGAGAASVGNQRIRIESRNGRIKATDTTVQGFDYAEYFENQVLGEIPAGTIVTLVDGKVEAAKSNTDVILGAISKTAGVIGNSASFVWQGRYLKDEFGEELLEDTPWVKGHYIDPDTDEVIDYNGPASQVDISTLIDPVTSVQALPVENPDYDPDTPYVDRSERKDQWSLVGILGQLYIRCPKDVGVAKYLDAMGRPSATPTRLKVMKVHMPFDPKKGYAVVQCFMR